MRLTVRRILIFRKDDAMRQRSHFIGLWLSDAEYAHISEQCRISGMSTSALLRRLIIGADLRPRPPDQYSALLRELSAIGNNINQIAYWANARQNVSNRDIQEASKFARQAWRLVKDNM